MVHFLFLTNQKWESARFPTLKQKSSMKYTNPQTTKNHSISIKELHVALQPTPVLGSRGHPPHHHHRDQALLGGVLLVSNIVEK